MLFCMSKIHSKFTIIIIIIIINKNAFLATGLEGLVRKYSSFQAMCKLCGLFWWLQDWGPYCVCCLKHWYCEYVCSYCFCKFNAVVTNISRLSQEYFYGKIFLVLVSMTSLVQEGYSHHTCGDSGLTVFFPVYFNICFMSGELKMGYDFIQGSGPGGGTRFCQPWGCSSLVEAWSNLSAEWLKIGAVRPRRRRKPTLFEGSKRREFSSFYCAFRVCE